MNFDEERLREAYAALHASGDVITEVKRMKNETESIRKIGKRFMAAAAAAALALALGITAFATGGFGLLPRSAAPEEQFRMYNWDSYWNNAKLALEVDGPEECHTIRFKPGWLPAPVPDTGLNRPDAEGWYTYLTGELGAKQPYLIETRYAPQFVHGGHLILLEMEPGEITEETWGDWQILKFDATHHSEGIQSPKFGIGIPPHDYRRSYCVMFQRAEGWILILSGENTDPATLERIGKDLEIDVTDQVVSAADYVDYNVFIDGGKG